MWRTKDSGESRSCRSSHSRFRGRNLMRSGAADDPGRRGGAHEGVWAANLLEWPESRDAQPQSPARGSSRIASMGYGGDRKRWGVRSGSSVESSGRHDVRPHLPMLEELVGGRGLRRPDCDLLDFDGEASLEQAWRSVQFLFVPVRGWIKLQQQQWCFGNR